LKTTYDLYGVAILRDGNVYISCPYTDDLLKLLKELKDVEVFFTTRRI